LTNWKEGKKFCSTQLKLSFSSKSYKIYAEDATILKRK